MAKRIVIFGGQGLVGSAIARELRGEQLTIPSSSQIPIEDKNSVDRVLSNIRPHEVYVCAAYTNVDKAESDPYAHKVNILGLNNIVTSRFIQNTRVVFMSSGYVFDGDKKTPYEVGDKTNPLSTYGLQKWAGEALVKNNCPNHLIVRTMSVFGKEFARKNFAYQVIDNLMLGKIVYVPEGQMIAPIYSDHLASAIVVGLREHKGIAHVNGTKPMSKIEFAKELARKWGLDETKVHPAPYNQVARRPANAVMKNSVEVVKFELGLEVFYATY